MPQATPPIINPKQQTPPPTTIAAASDSTMIMSRDAVSTTIKTNTVVSGQSISDAASSTITMIVKDKVRMKPGLGPFLGAFPTDILFEIFRWTIVLEHATAKIMDPDRCNPRRIIHQFQNGHPYARHYSATGNIITKSKFDYFMALSLLDKLSVSKGFGSLVQEFLYRTNVFSFSPVNTTTMLGNRLSAQLPPHGLRHHLRRIQITLHLEDFYMQAPRHLVPWEESSDLIYNQITTVDDLMVFCPGARTLRNLTDVNPGGCNKLTYLEITIIPHIEFGEAEAVALWQAARFAVEADEVFIQFKSNANTIAPAQQWHSTLIEINLRNSS